MNKSDRKQISEWINQLNKIKCGIEEMQESEEEKFYNLPEGIQDSERGESLHDAVGTLEFAADSIGDAIEYLIDAKE